MNRKRKIIHICKFCGESADMQVITDSDGYNVIKCPNCGFIVTEGFGEPEELLNDCLDFEIEE